MLRSGFEVVVGQHRTISSALEQQVRTLPLSLDDTDAVERLLDYERPDVVVHLASTIIPASDVGEYLEERRTVLDPSLRLLLSLAERKVHLVFFSSGGAIYGRTGERAPSEESDCRPISFYGQAKLEMEEFIRFLGRTVDVPYLIVRPSNPFARSRSADGRALSPQHSGACAMEDPCVSGAMARS